MLGCALITVQKIKLASQSLGVVGQNGERQTFAQAGFIKIFCGPGHMSFTGVSGASKNLKINIIMSVLIVTIRYSRKITIKKFGSSFEPEEQNRR